MEWNIVEWNGMECSAMECVMKWNGMMPVVAAD